jgi:hypothetical protein
MSHDKQREAPESPLSVSLRRQEAEGPAPNVRGDGPQKIIRRAAVNP